VSAFAQYAEFYDLFYVRKSYSVEAAHVARLIQIWAPSTLSLLDIGCGTGRHAVQFAERGYRVRGIDRSADMLREFGRRLDAATPGIREAVGFTQADAADFDLGCTFDAATGLYHVFSYLAEEGEVGSALRCLRRHLLPGSLLIFDYWHQPALEAQPPQKVVKEMRTENRCVRRIVMPTCEPARRRVTIRLIVESESDEGDSHRFEEQHVMRCFDADEIRRALSENGFSLVALTDGMTDNPCTDSSFSACAVAIAR
jgi:SAM-dependent methyltransferase